MNPKVHRFITGFTTARHVSLSLAASIHVPIQLIQESILTSSFHLRLAFASDLFPSGLPTKTPMHLASLPYMQHAPPIFSIWWPE